MNTPEPTSDGTNEHVVDGQSPSNKYVWIGDQYVPIESLM